MNPTRIWQQPYHSLPPRQHHAANKRLLRRFFWLTYFAIQSTLIATITYPFLLWKPSSR